jgi:hypothetical protein
MLVLTDGSAAVAVGLCAMYIMGNMTIDLCYDLRCNRSTYEYYNTILRARHVNVGVTIAIVVGDTVSYRKHLMPLFYANVTATIIYAIFILPVYHQIVNNKNLKAVNEKAFRNVVVARMAIFLLLSTDCVWAIRAAGEPEHRW